jgi:hypothetical protein
VRPLPAAGLVGLLAAAPLSGDAQIIPVRAVPLSQAHQIDIFPSRTSAMGGVSIAVADPLLDPFVNPAKGSRLEGPRFFGSPVVYSVSDGAGAGRTLPLGALTRVGPWHGGLSIGLQQVDLSEQTGSSPPFIQACSTCRAAGLDGSEPPRSFHNRYAFASLGRDLSAAGLSLGASVLWSGLNAVDGVDLLYPGSVRIEQPGHSLDVRLGALKEWPGGRSLEVLALHRRVRSAHEVLFVEPYWDPAQGVVAQRPRLERNAERGSTWGLHVEYERPLPHEGWRVGWLGTVNLTSHPETPDYERVSVPGDAGRSTAINAGVGLAKVLGTSTFGLDVIYEPVWSQTWAEADAPVETYLGATIPAGGRVIENDVRFSNVVLRMGAEEEVELTPSGAAVGIQVGLAVRGIRSRLAQRDHVRLEDRSREERWTEWTPTWGLSLRSSGLEVRYRGHVTHGLRRPGVRPLGGGCFDVCVAVDALVLPGRLIGPAPVPALAPVPVSVAVHQVFLSIPMGCCGLPTASRLDTSREDSR